MFYSLGAVFPIPIFFLVSTFPTMPSIRRQKREFLAAEICEGCRLIVQRVVM